MDILVIGSGAREHTLARELLKSEQVEQVYCLPGNPGMQLDQIKTAAIDVNDFEQLIVFAKKQAVAYTVVGPEQPLVAGIVDAFQAAGLAIFGPAKQAAALEGSKTFAKKMMAQAQVPTAQYQTVTNESEALYALEGRSLPIVIKADGLAAGKGVVIAESLADGLAAVRRFFKQGRRQILIEDYLIGEEFSLMALVADDQVYPLPITQDHKRAFEGDRGPNTGGMGAYCPVPQISDQMVQTAVETIIKPVVATMAANGTPFTGVLYAGLIATATGIKVIEFNVRFGDPETQVVLPRLQGDLAQVFQQLLTHQQPTLDWQADGVTLGVVVAAKGYPNQTPAIFQLAPTARFKGANSHFSFAGVVATTGGLMSAGGRLYTAVYTAPTMAQARVQIEAGLQSVADPQSFFRRDIGFKSQM